MNTGELLDLARSRQGVSDYGLCKLLGVGTSTVSNYRNGRSHPDEDMAKRLAELAGLDPLLVVAWMQAERSRTEAGRATWRAIAERLAATAAAVCVCTAISGGPDAHARSLAGQALTGGAEGRLYIMFTLRRALRRLLGGLNPRSSGLALA